VRSKLPYPIEISDLRFLRGDNWPGYAVPPVRPIYWYRVEQAQRTSAIKAGGKTPSRHIAPPHSQQGYASMGVLPWCRLDTVVNS
jgi:hypothetical protein